MNSNPKSRKSTIIKYLQFLHHISKLNPFSYFKQAKIWKVNRYMMTWLINEDYLTKVKGRVKWSGPDPSIEMVESFLEFIHDYTMSRKNKREEIERISDNYTPAFAKQMSFAKQLTLDHNYPNTMSAWIEWVNIQNDPKVIQDIEEFSVQFLKKSKTNNYQILKSL